MKTDGRAPSEMSAPTFIPGALRSDRPAWDSVLPSKHPGPTCPPFKVSQGFVSSHE